MDVHDITEGEEECLKTSAVVEKLERLRENLRNIGHVAFKIDDILHCLNHCSGILQRDETTIGKLRRGLSDDSGETLSDSFKNALGLLDTYDSEIKIANESVRQEIQYIYRDTTIDDCSTRLTDINAGLSHFVESISEPRHHEQIVESVRKVNDTVEIISSLVGGTSASRLSSSRAKAGSRENSNLYTFYQPTARNTRSSDTGLRKSYVESVEDSDSEMMYGKKALMKKKIKADSDEDFDPNPNPYGFHDDYPRNTQPNHRMRNMDSMLSAVAESETIDTGSQDYEFEYEYDNSNIVKVINKPRPVASNSNSNSKSKIRAIKHTFSQDDPDYSEVSPEVAACKPSVVPKVHREPGTTRSAFKNVEVSASAKKAPDAAVANDNVISIDDENSNEAILIAEMEPAPEEPVGAAATSTISEIDGHHDDCVESGSQEESMVRTEDWQANTYGDHAPFEDRDDRDDSQYQSQMEHPVSQQVHDFPSPSRDDSEESVSEEEGDEVATRRNSPQVTGLSTRSSDERARRVGSSRGASIARAFQRPRGGKESPATTAASALVQTIHTPNRNHIREEKQQPTPCTAQSTTKSTATAASSAEPKSKSSWPTEREDIRVHPQNQEHPLPEERSQVLPFTDNGTGTQSDSEASSSRTKTHRKSRFPEELQSKISEHEEVSRARTGPGHATQRHCTPRQPPQPAAANMLGSDARFSYKQTSPALSPDNAEESQEWLDAKGRSGKRPRGQSEDQLEEGRKQKQLQSDEVRRHRAPANTPSVLPAASPAALPSSRGTRRREDIEHMASAQSMNDVVDLTDT